MHKNLTHNREPKTIRDFANAFLGFLRTDVPQKWDMFHDYVSDNFRDIDPADFRVVRWTE